jgi:CDP-glucose 4,6-dehydratase
VQWLVQRICEQWGPDALWNTDTNHHPHEAGYLKLDSSMARTHLGWRSRLELATALNWTVEWYRAYRDKGDMRTITVEHIRRFMAS